MLNKLLHKLVSDEEINTFLQIIIVGFFFLLIERWEIMKKNLIFGTYGLILSLFLLHLIFFGILICGFGLDFSIFVLLG